MRGILVQRGDIDSSLLKSTSSTITLKTTQRLSQKNSKVERGKQSGLNPGLQEPHPTDKGQGAVISPWRYKVSLQQNRGVSAEPCLHQEPRGWDFLPSRPPDREGGTSTRMPPQNGDPPSHPRGNMGLVGPLQQVPRTINSLPAQRQNSFYHLQLGSQQATDLATASSHLPREMLPVRKNLSLPSPP